MIFIQAKMWITPLAQFYKEGDKLKRCSLIYRKIYERGDFEFIFDSPNRLRYELEPSPMYNRDFFVANGETIEKWVYPPGKKIYRGCGFDGILPCYAKIRENGKEGYINIVWNWGIPYVFTEDYEDIKKGTLVYVSFERNDDMCCVRPFLTTLEYGRYVPQNILEVSCDIPEEHVPFPI